MRTPERLTIDVTVARDFLDPSRTGHSRARELFELARAGDVETATSASGYIFDLDGDLAEQVRAMLEDENVTETPQLSYPGVMYPGKGAYPGAGVEGFGEIWDELLAELKAEGRVKRLPSLEDSLHVETHVLTGGDVFITDDGPLRAMCQRLRERGIAVDAVSLEEYLVRRRSRAPVETRGRKNGPAA